MAWARRPRGEMAREVAQEAVWVRAASRQCGQDSAGKTAQGETAQGGDEVGGGTVRRRERDGVGWETAGAGERVSHLP